MITALEILGGFMLLLFGAEYLVRGAVSLANRLSISPMVIGLTIVAYGTTAPELVVSLEGALRGQPGIAIGNVVGSNIANILLILGAASLITPIAAPRSLLRRDGLIMMAASLVFMALALGGTISRFQGGVLVMLLIGYSLFAYIQERRTASPAGDTFSHEAEEFSEGPQSLWLALISVIGGIAAVVFGARILVGGAIDLARMLGVGEEVIGLTLVAIGTSLPELATAVVAAYRRQTDVAIGNIVGANIYNLLAIIGLVAVVQPLDIPAQILRFDLWFMLLVTAALLLVIRVRRGVTRVPAAFFLLVYAGYVAAQYSGILG